MDLVNTPKPSTTQKKLKKIPLDSHSPSSLLQREVGCDGGDRREIQGEGRGWDAMEVRWGLGLRRGGERRERHREKRREKREEGIRVGCDGGWVRDGREERGVGTEGERREKIRN
ncbi:unnamed protein product [Prunus brigantina]